MSLRSMSDWQSGERLPWWRLFKSNRMRSKGSGRANPTCWIRTSRRDMLVRDELFLTVFKCCDGRRLVAQVPCTDTWIDSQTDT